MREAVAENSIIGLKRKGRTGRPFLNARSS
jgi:hypothetical protein